VFPVRYELDWYILFIRSSVFKSEWEESEGSQSRQTVECGLEPRGTRNLESLYWRGPAAI
jgi:hypothetical protein